VYDGDEDDSYLREHGRHENDQHQQTFNNDSGGNLAEQLGADFGGQSFSKEQGKAMNITSSDKTYQSPEDSAKAPRTRSFKKFLE